MQSVNIRYGKKQKKHCMHAYRKVKLTDTVYYFKCAFCGKDLKIRIWEDKDSADI